MRASKFSLAGSLQIFYCFDGGYFCKQVIVVVFTVKPSTSNADLSVFSVVVLIDFNQHCPLKNCAPYQCHWARVSSDTIWSVILLEPID